MSFVPALLTLCLAGLSLPGQVLAVAPEVSRVNLLTAIALWGPFDVRPVPPNALIVRVQASEFITMVRGEPLHRVSEQVQLQVFMTDSNGRFMFSLIAEAIEVVAFEISEDMTSATVSAITEGRESFSQVIMTVAVEVSWTARSPPTHRGFSFHEEVPDFVVVVSQITREGTAAASLSGALTTSLGEPTLAFLARLQSGFVDKS